MRLKAGTDPELDFGGPLLSFSGEKFLNTIVFYRKYCGLSGMAPESALVEGMCLLALICVTMKANYVFHFFSFHHI